MKRCWEKSLKNRSNFESVYTFLSELSESDKDVSDTYMPQPHLDYENV
jgi:hypothetical protein